MSQNQSGRSVLILVANGVDEVQLTEMQRALTKAGAKFCTVAPEQGLVNSWHDNAWGHYFPVDKVIGEVLGSDFDVLVLPGGERSVAKLKQNLHTRRILNHFIDAKKPVSAIGAGVALIALATRCAGHTVAALETLVPELTAAQLEISPDATEQDGNVLTAQGAAPQEWIDALIAEISDEAVAAAA